MVEPPRYPRIGGILEIHDGVFVTVEQAGFEELGCFVGHPREDEFRAGVDRAGKETRKESCGGRTVEAMIVIKDSYPHEANFRKTLQIA